ncbi:hypothetical protein EMIHUDRAFT_251473 [Emiliania huxleyi CCMP1516]|uniref:Phosphorylated adapter RNA export protein n=2 Tax=Emiliania huxleyi TaxID=2903 RepID=A0A0D3KTS6_EMIH1|nr:hypothetical protein EMIHUDRAFT_251473 [Emiliania huxleyi CCMP1516]EOD39161.1 hypothetical protein EMIHUDRAFT_251473 [Emiliania huxleyi CCMP1516]|eukprot:XP_005791590.1 hypothetical protein EMIHUDRAFT_251473 [Emiliania huxleyi CCMP1516]
MGRGIGLARSWCGRLGLLSPKAAEARPLGLQARPLGLQARPPGLQARPPGLTLPLAFSLPLGLARPSGLGRGLEPMRGLDVDASNLAASCLLPMAASLTSLVADLEEVAHPLGGMAFERTAVTRNDRPQRPLLDYDLSDFGAVGELTVQMHTEAVPYGLSTAAGGGYEALLSDFAKHSAEKRQAKPARAPAPAGGGSRRPAVGREARGGPRGGPRGGTARGSEVPPESYVCHNCRQPGHWIANCPLPRQSKRPRDDAICNVPGHFVADCPLAPRERAAERPPPPPGYVCRKCNQSGHWVELCQLRGHHNPAPAVPPVTPSAESAEVGRDIAEALEEAEEEAVEQICRLVEVLGEEACRGLLVQAWQVEENGGLLRTDGSGQRRTPGGVFLWLVKQQATPEQRARVWPKAGQETPATAK